MAKLIIGHSRAIICNAHDAKNFLHFLRFKQNPVPTFAIKEKILFFILLLSVSRNWLLTATRTVKLAQLLNLDSALSRRLIIRHNVGLTTVFPPR